MQANVNILISGFSDSERILLSETGTGSQEVRETVADETTDAVLNLALDVSTMTFAYLLSTQALTIKTYDAEDTLVDTIVLAANAPKLYIADPAVGVNPFTGDCAYATVTNASGASATLKVFVLADATP